jgi:hypothetical protein
MSQEFGKNIWGKQGCELPTGALCDACCKLKGIQDPLFTDGHKPIGVTCDFMKRKMGKGEGCGLHGLSPEPCQAYHCSQDRGSPGVWARLIATAFHEGLVTHEEAWERLEYFTGRESLIGPRNS